MWKELTQQTSANKLNKHKCFIILFINNNARKKGEQIKTTDYVMIQIMIPGSNVYVQYNDNVFNTFLTH